MINQQLLTRIRWSLILNKLLSISMLLQLAYLTILANKLTLLTTDGVTIGLPRTQQE
jgi:hypothetical protein